MKGVNRLLSTNLKSILNATEQSRAKEITPNLENQILEENSEGQFFKKFNSLN